MQLAFVRGDHSSSLPLGRGRKPIARPVRERYTEDVIGKALVGLAVTLVLAACPFAAEASAAAPVSCRHSCCPASKRSAPAGSGLRSTGDCCLRAPAHGTLSVASPRPSAPAVLVEVPPVPAVRRRAPVALASLSPPGEGVASPAASPRAPPLPA